MRAREHEIYAFGAEDAPVILLLPGTCCRWRSNFGHVIPLLADDCRVRCVSYDGWWVGHTKAWIIPGTEDLRPHITAADKRKKWMAGTVGMAVIAAVLAGIMVLLVR